LSAEVSVWETQNEPGPGAFDEEHGGGGGVERGKTVLEDPLVRLGREDERFRVGTARSNESWLKFGRRTEDAVRKPLIATPTHKGQQVPAPGGVGMGLKGCPHGGLARR
jgi:hypothetical protein